MRILTALFIFGAALAEVTQPAQPASPYVPTETQQLKVNVATLKVELAYKDLIQTREWNVLQQAGQELSQVCRAVADENKWPQTVGCDPKTGEFRDSTPQQVPKENKK